MYFKLVNGLENPIDAQDIISSIPYDFNNTKHVASPFYALKKDAIVCFEAALLSAALLSSTHKPIVLGMSSDDNMPGQAVFVFNENGKLGAVGKSINPKNEWRDPVFSSINELVKSYGHTNYQIMDWSRIGDWKITNRNMNEYLFLWPERSIYDSVKGID